jgi:ElaB/YqjD/DUF883 family membrane-anchored ribosome-binding protein
VAQGTKEQQLRSDIARVRAEIVELRDDLGETLDELGDRASPKRMVQRRGERLRVRVRRVREVVMGPAHSAASTVQGGARGAVDQAGNVASTVADQARQAPEMIQRQTQGNPIAAGMVAFGIGLLVANLVPASEPERQAAGALQDKLEPLKDHALEAGQEMKDQVQEAAREGMQHVKDTATDAAQQVKDDAQSAGEHVTEDAQQGVQQARSDSPTA